MIKTSPSFSNSNSSDLNLNLSPHFPKSNGILVFFSNGSYVPTAGLSG